MHVESFHIRRRVMPPHRGALLVAEPFLDEGCFRRAVICLAEYSEKGAVGFVLNSPTRYVLSELLEGENDIPSIPVFCGGPAGTDIKYDEKEEVVNMCKAWDDHKKLGIQEGMKQGIQQGMKQGMQQGRCLEVYSLVQDGILDPEVGASRVSMSLDDFADAMQKAGYKLPEMV